MGGAQGVGGAPGPGTCCARLGDGTAVSRGPPKFSAAGARDGWGWPMVADKLAVAFSIAIRRLVTAVCASLATCMAVAAVLSELVTTDLSCCTSLVTVSRRWFVAAFPCATAALMKSPMTSYVAGVSDSGCCGCGGAAVMGVATTGEGELVWVLTAGARDVGPAVAP